MAITTTHKGGSRFYVDSTDPDITVPGVTSVIGQLAKPFLQHWTAKLSAELAVDSLDFVAQMAERDRQGAVDYLKGAARRYTKIRADVGSEAHDLFERMIRGEHVGRVSQDMEPYRAHFADFLAEVNPELVRAEDVAWSDEHEYAGSFDAILRVWIDPETRKPRADRKGVEMLLVADWKTSKSIYADVALQMAAYAHADRLIDPDGHSVPMPEFDGAAVLHITPEHWDFRPVDISDQVFEHFLSLRHTFVWDKEVSRRVIGKSLAKSTRVVTGTERRAR